MVNLNLTHQEVVILIQMVDDCIGDLHEEIRRTDNIGYKDMLKDRKEVLGKLRFALQQSQEQPPSN